MQLELFERKIINMSGNQSDIEDNKKLAIQSENDIEPRPKATADCSEIDHDALSGGKFVYPLLNMQVCFKPIIKYAYKSNYELEFDSSGNCKSIPVNESGYEYETHLPMMPGDRGPFGYPVAYAADGALVEYVYHNQPLLLRRGDKAIADLQEKYWAINLYYTLIDYDKTEPDYELMQNKCLLIKEKYGLGDMRPSSYAIGVIAGMYMALGWVKNMNSPDYQEFEKKYGIIEISEKILN